MKERAIYVHFDGMDLAGKSTATRLFVDQSGHDWDTRRNSILEENSIHQLADKLRKEGIYDPETIGNLYYAALMADVRTFQWPGRDTIQDSTLILRSIAFHTVRSTPRLPEMFLELIKLHPQFSGSFVFTASIEQRRKRLEKRLLEAPETVSEEDMMVINKPEKFLAMEKCLAETAVRYFNALVIDTSSRTPEEVVSMILQSLKTK